MRVGQTSVIYLGANVLSSVAGFLATIYFTRTLPESELGTYFLAVAVLIWASVVFGRPFQSAVTKRLSETGESEYLTAGFCIQTGGFVLVAGGALLFRAQLNAYLGVDAVLPLLGLLFAALAFDFVKASLQGERRTHLAALLQPVNYGSRALVQVAVVSVGLGVFGLLAGYGVALVLGTLVGVVVLQARPGLPARYHFDRLLSFARYSWLGKVSSRAFASMDTIVLGVFVAKSFVTYYEIAWNLASVLAIFGAGISQTLFPEISKLAADQNQRQVEVLVEDSLAYAGLFLIPGVVGSLLIGDLVLRVYAPQYAIAAQVLTVLMASRLIYAYGGQLTNALSGVDRPDLAFRVNLAFIAVNVTLNVGLVAVYGWIGAAVATTVSAAVALVLGYLYLQSLLTVRVPIGELARQAAAAGGMALVVAAARQPLPTTWQAGFGLALTGGVVYFGLLFGLSARFRRTIGDNLPLA